MAKKKTAAEKAADDIDKMRRAGAIINKATRPSKTNQTASRAVRDDEIKTEHRNTKPDTNLSDEKGKDIETRHYKDKKGQVWDRTIYGGDPDDPRWNEHKKREAESKRKRFYGEK